MPSLWAVPSRSECGAEVTKAKKDFKQVLARAKSVTHAIVGKVVPGADEEAARIVWEKTEAEVQHGKTMGPFDAWVSDEQLGALWLPAPRVGLRQREQNSTSSTVESPATGSVDEVTALIKTFAAATASGVASSSGSAWGDDVFEVCKDYVGVDAGQMIGRTLDLEKASKNLSPSPASRSFMVVAVWHPIKRRVVYYRLPAMLLGARNSVYSFAGFGKAFQMFCFALFWLLSSEYVDDFMQEALRADAKAGQWMSPVMELLGWRVQSDPEKTKGFSTIFHAPSVVLNCAEVACGALHVVDRPGRVESVMQLVIQAEEKGILSPPMASTIKGKLQCTRSQSFGRAGDRASGIEMLRGWRWYGKRCRWETCAVLDEALRSPKTWTGAHW